MTAKDFLMGLPEKINKENHTDISTVLHFELADEAYTVNIVNGQAECVEGLEGEPEVSMKAKPDDFVKMVTGELNPMTAMMFGKLKITNPGAMMKYAKMLGLM